MSFSSIPIRSNAYEALASWWNLLRLAGMALEGSGAIRVTSFTVVNNQVAAASITGILMVSGTFKSALIEGVIMRKTDSAGTVRALFRVAAHYDGTNWVLSDPTWDNDVGITLSMTTAGQLQYVSTDISGANYSSNADISVRTFQ